MDNNQIQQPASEGNKTMLWLIIGLVLVILLVGGIYWYLSKQQETTPQPTLKPPTTESNLERDLNSIEVQTSDTEFDALDKDLQSL